MEKLIFGVNSFLLKLNGTISRTETVFSRPSPIDKKHAMRLAPTIVNWLQTASTELGSAKSGHGPLVEVLRAAFESGETKGINRLGAEVDGALKILLTACDISARVDDPDDNLARTLLVGVFCELICRSSHFPHCLLLEIQSLDDTYHLTTDYADIYSGTHNGQLVNLKVPNTIKRHGSRILDSRLLRRDLAIWRTLPPNEHILPFLGVSQITVSGDEYVCLVSPRVGGVKLAEHIRTLTSRDAPSDCEIVPSIVTWVQEVAHGLLHLHDNGIVHGRLCGDTIILTPEGHIQLVGFESTAFEYAELDAQPISGYPMSFSAPELLSDTNEGVTSPSFPSDVWAFGCVCVQLFNEGNDPFNQASDTVTKRRVMQGCYPPHTRTIPDDIWDIAERCWVMYPEQRPSMQVVVDKLAQAHNKPRDFLCSILVSSAAMLSDDVDRQSILEELVALVRSRELQKVVDYRDSDAQHAFHILDEILTGCYSGRYNLPMGTRSTLRILLLELASAAEIFPESFFVTGVKCLPGFRNFMRSGSSEISKGTYQHRHVGIKAMLVCYVRDREEARESHRNLVTESIVWKTLPHERIIPFIGIEFKAIVVLPTMVSPWMENGNARTYVEQVKGQGKVFRSRVNKLLHQTALAVEFLHGEDVAHGDLRGANVLVDAEGNAVLADFGLAVLYGASRPEFRVSSHDGHPSYMAPERVNPVWYNEEFPDWRHPPPSLRSDIYSFGCLCIELYACDDPYRTIYLTAVARKVLNNEPPKRPRNKGCKMPDVLWELVCRCMERKDLSKRLRAKQVVEARIIDMV